MKEEINSNNIVGVIERSVSISQITRSDDDKGYRFLISDETVDSYGTVFRADGWENGTSFEIAATYGHPWIGDSDPDKASIARSKVEVDVERKEVWAFIPDDYWDDGEPANPYVAKVKRKLANKTLKDASIRAVVNKGHWGDKKAGEDPDVIYFTSQRMLDWGIVPIGANPNAGLRSHEEVVSRIVGAKPVAEKEDKEEVQQTGRLNALKLRHKHLSI